MMVAAKLNQRHYPRQRQHSYGYYAISPCWVMACRHPTPHILARRTCHLA
jgi:hypothetical protein